MSKAQRADGHCRQEAIPLAAMDSTHFLEEGAAHAEDGSQRQSCYLDRGFEKSFDFNS
jgi:hypothetical protein